MIEFLLPVISGIVGVISTSLATKVFLQNRRLNKKVEDEYKELLINLEQINASSANKEVKAYTQKEIELIIQKLMNVKEVGAIDED